MARREREVHPYDIGKEDISLLKLVNYNLLFFIPILLFMILSLWLGDQLSGYFEASPLTVSRILMYVFSFGIFFFIIPFIRKRENISGVRYSVVAFLLVGIGLTLPAALKGNFDFMFSLLNYFAHYVLLTFIFAPEVLGISSNLADWFARGKQLSVFFVYVMIILLYIIGFGTLYHSIYNDPMNHDTFTTSVDKPLTAESFVYYSFVTFASLGYGDITPISTAARVVASLEILVGMIVNVLFIAMLLLYVSGAQSIMIKKEGRKIDEEKRHVEREERKLERVEEKIEGVEKREQKVESLLERIKNL
ncbi:MAG: hypothetical protein KJ574_03200 [Nanoarchaeota archaeon]|nr:hypothetical protein [Nanoarchaeota archaeon]